MPPTAKRLYPQLAEELKNYARPDLFLGWVTKVSDGDTIHCFLQLGFGVELPNVRIRLLGIDAPEITGHTKMQGIAARQKLHHLLYETWVVIQTYHDQAGKFGRELAIVWTLQQTNLINVNQWLIKNQIAKPMKINRFFDGDIHNIPPQIERCDQCNSFILPTLGVRSMKQPIRGSGKLSKAGSRKAWPPSTKPST